MPGPVIFEEQLHDCWAYYLTDNAYAFVAPGSLPSDRMQGIIHYQVPQVADVREPLGGSKLLPGRTGSATIYEVTDHYACYTTPHGGFGAFAFREARFVGNRVETDCPKEPNPIPVETTWTIEAEEL